MIVLIFITDIIIMLFGSWVELTVYNWLILRLTNYPLRFVEILSISLFISLLRYKPSDDEGLGDDEKWDKFVHRKIETMVACLLFLLYAYVIKQFI